VKENRVIPERRIHVLVHDEAGNTKLVAEVADPEVARGPGAARPIVVEGADDPSPHAQVAEGAGEVLGGSLVTVRPLVAAVLAPELRVSVVERVGNDVVVAELMLGVGAAGELRLARERVMELVDPTDSSASRSTCQRPKSPLPNDEEMPTGGEPNDEATPVSYDAALDTANRVIAGLPQTPADVPASWERACELACSAGGPVQSRVTALNWRARE